MPDIYYTVKEVSELLKCNKETIRRRLKNKAIKGFKYGKNWLIAATELKNFIKESEKK